MESFLPSEIARLVLGYLEDQKCEEAYSTFLKTSIHLEECLKMKEDGRKFRTQVLGLSLLDILYEYSAIYSLVQERLKKVDPEAVERLKHSGTLLDKITFLLNSTSSGQTMLFSISLPPGNSPQTSTVAHAHVRKRLRTSSCNDKRKDTSRKSFKANDNNETSIIEASSNVQNLETTNLSSLPGNLNQNLSLTGLESDIIRTPKRKMPGSNNKRQSRASSVVPEELEENFDITALTQALLDNHELHEKIAENINKVICTPENNANVSVAQDACSAQNPTPDTNTSVQNTNNFTMELDNVIKKIVHDTESDPIFENFLHEVVGPPGQEETSDDYDDRGISNTSTPSKSAPETVKKQTAKNRNRSAKLKRANSSENIVNIIDDHNAVAIESIISINAPESTACADVIKNIENVASSTAVPTIIPTITNAIVPENTIIPPIPVITPASNQNLTVDTTTVIPTNITNIEQNILANQNKNLLMIGPQPIQPQQQQQQHQQQAPTFVITDSFPSLYQQPTLMPDNRIIFLSNKTSAIGSQYLAMPPTFQISQPAAVISDNDILSMPTVYISDDSKTSSGYIISQPTCSKRPKTVRKSIHKPKPRFSPRKIIQKKKSPINKESTTTQETETIKYTISIQAEPKQSTSENEIVNVIENEEILAPPSTSGLANSDAKKDPLMEKNITPEKAKSTSSSKLHLSLSSPRSNKSHIRALDFSTPPKENHSPRKASTSPKSQHTSHKSPKAIRKLSTALFVSPVKSRKLPIATKSPKVKLKGDWNEDLIVTDKTSDNDKNKKSPKLRRSGGEKEVNVPSEDSESMPCECKSKPVTKKLTSWDHELRSLIVPVPSTSQPKKSPAKKRTRSSQRNKEKKEKKSNANTTETEVLSIEAELAKMEDNEPEKLTIDSEAIIEEKEHVSEESEPKKAQPDKKKKSNSKSSKTAVQKVELNIREETTPEKIEEPEKPEETVNNTSNPDSNKSTQAESLRNMTPKIRKKCNTSSSSKKANSDESKPKPTKIEANNQTIEMTVLSPSKMDKDASKKTLDEQLATDNMQTEKDNTQPENDFLMPSNEVTKSLPSIITPNIPKASCSHEVTANRNLIPVLETPMKEDSLLLPITPRLFTPFNLDSPLTRLLGEKMNTGDLAPFLSPSFPMTPSFPVTPNLQSGDTQSSYASRPTDYSNSSSYYQPSDSEQNQKLEQVLIDEAMKIETSDLKSKHLKTSTPCKTSDSSDSSAVVVPNNETGVIAKARLSGSLLDQSMNTSQSSLDSSTASSSNTSSSSSSSNNTTKENINKDDGNVTVIQAAVEDETQKEKIVGKTPNRELCVRLIKTPLIRSQDSPPVIKDNTSDNNAAKEPIKRGKGRLKSPLKRSNEKANKAMTVTNKAAEANKGMTVTNKATVSNKATATNKATVTNKATATKRPGRPRKVNAKQVDDDKETVEKHREIKSNVTGSHVTLLKELEEKRKRTITELKTAKPGRPKKNLTKENKIIIKSNPRVTRASVNKIDSIEKPATNKDIHAKLVDKVLEPPFIPRKSKTPQKSSIESVAAKLLKDKKCDVKKDHENIASISIETNESFCSPIASPNISISTIGQDDGLISYTPDEEIPRLHISSDEENIDETLKESDIKQKKIDDDSDLLVKELKERGIYLIPNKEKKSEQLVKDKENEEKRDLLTDKNEEEKNAERLQSVPSEPIKEKSDKIEIMSDIHLDKSKVIDVSKIELSHCIITDVISRTSSKNNEPVEENTVAKEPVQENVVCNKALQENVVCNEVLQENVVCDKVQQETNKDVSKESVNNSDSTLDVSEGSDYDFHVKVVDEDSPEFIKITYDETSKTQKGLTDYNFTVLKRNISAKIYLEEFDRWEDKTFTVTPYINIYSISPKRKRSTDNKATKTTDNAKSKKLVKPSETMSKTVDSNKSETKANTKSETKAKIADSNKSETKEKTAESKKSETKAKVVDTNKSESKAKAKDSNKSESKSSLKPLEILYNECVDESSTDTIITIKDSEAKTKLTKSNSNENDKKEKQISKDIVTSSKSSVKKTISLEQYKINKNKDSKTVQKTKDEVDLECEVIETSVEEEDLMTFALTGANKDSNNQELNSRKRKAAEESMKQNVEKRMKPNDKHALLKNIDVDSFLTKVHGPSEKS